MADINLIPKGLGQKTLLVRTIRYVKTLNLVGTVVFVLACTLILALLVLNTVTINSLSGRVDNLKSQIKSKQQVEQQYFLLKDRLGALVQIYSDNNLFSELENYSLLFSSLKQSARVASVSVGKGGVEMMTNFYSTADLRAFFQTALNSGYKRIVIDSLSYHSGSGYQALVQFYLDDK